MPRQFMEDYYSEEDFEVMLKRLNALSPDLFPWQPTMARKKHEDLFGEIVHKDEVYFKRDRGPGWGNTIKLSRLSMERILFALFSGNHSLEEFAERISEQRLQALQDEHARYSPLSGLRERKSEVTKAKD